MSNLQQIGERLREQLFSRKQDYIDLFAHAQKEEQAALEALSSSEDKTDRRENASYENDYAAYMKAEAELAHYSKRIEAFNSFNYKYIPLDNIQIGTTVQLELLTNLIKSEHEFTLLVVSAGLGDAEHGYLDVTSPVGAAILHKKVGDTISVSTASGVNRYRIKEIY